MPSTKWLCANVFLESKENEVNRIRMMSEEISSIEISLSFVFDHRWGTRIEKIELMFDDLHCFQCWKQIVFVLIDDSVVDEQKIDLDCECDIRQRFGLSCSIKLCNDSETITEELTSRTIKGWWTQTSNVLVVKNSDPSIVDERIIYP